MADTLVVGRDRVTIPGTAYLGSDFEFDLPPLSDGEDPTDLEGAVYEIDIRDSFEDGSRTLIRLHSETDGFIVLDDRPNGLGYVRVPRAEFAAAVPPGNWVWVARLTQIGSQIGELWRGPFIALGAPLSAGGANYQKIDIDLQSRREGNFEARHSENLKLYLQVMEGGHAFDLDGWTTSILIFDIGYAVALSETMTVDEQAAGKLSLDVANSEVATWDPGSRFYMIFGQHAVHGYREFRRGYIFVKATYPPVVLYRRMDIDRHLPRRTEIEQRDSEDLKLYVQLFENGRYFSLSGWTVTFNVVIDGANGVSEAMTVDTSSEGKLSLSVAAATVDDWAAGRHAWRIVGTHGTHGAREFQHGAFVLVPTLPPQILYKRLDIDRFFRRWTDLEARHSEDLELFLQLFQSGRPFSLTDWTVKIICHPTFGHSTEIFDVTLNSAVGDGKLSSNVAKSTVAGWAAGRWTYVLVGTHGTFGDREFQRGNFTIQKGAWS